MRIRHLGGKAATFGLVVTIGATFGAGSVTAQPRQGSPAYAGSTGYHAHTVAAAYHRRVGGLQCVPFARENTGIELVGNAVTWWNSAEGIYERGAKPEVGSVLNFRANGHMRMGHVAVVSNVVDSRMIEVDHANWSGPGGISRNISVIDVSPNNDWTAVRVALGHSEAFGSVYPTYGFIYDRPDHGVMVANNNIAPVPLLNAAPHDLRPAADRYQFAIAMQDNEEVAEADDVQPRFHGVWARHGGGRYFTGHAYASRASWTSRTSWHRAHVARVHTGVTRHAHHRKDHT